MRKQNNPQQSKPVKTANTGLVEDDEEIMKLFNELEGVNDSEQISDIWANLTNMIPFMKWEEGKIYDMEVPSDLEVNTKLFNDRFAKDKVPYLKIKVDSEFRWVKIQAKSIRKILLFNKGKSIKIKREGKGSETKYIVL